MPVTVRRAKHPNGNPVVRKKQLRKRQDRDAFLCQFLEQELNPWLRRQIQARAGRELPAILGDQEGPPGSSGQGGEDNGGHGSSYGQGEHACPQWGPRGQKAGRERGVTRDQRLKSELQMQKPPEGRQQSTAPVKAGRGGTSPPGGWAQTEGGQVPGRPGPSSLTWPGQGAKGHPRGP